MVLYSATMSSWHTQYFCNHCNISFNTYLLSWYVLIYSKIIMSKSQENTLKWLFFNMLMLYVATLPKDHCVQQYSHGNTPKYVDTVTVFKNLPKKSVTRRWLLTPISAEVTCVTLPKDHCIQVPWKYIKVLDTVTIFQNLFTKRSMTQMTLR